MEQILTSAKAARAAFVSGEVSAAEIARAMLERIAARPDLTIFREVLTKTALADAVRADDLRRRGADPGPLAGLCIAIKENCDIAQIGTSAGMRALIGRRPAQDAWVTARAHALGATIIGTTISDPGAFGVVTREVTHPLDPALSVGGSSGGSGAALAAGFCHGAIGTDTGGSIRIPAALCGVAGLKPAFGQWSLQGVWPLVPSLDHVGPMARDAADLALLDAAFMPGRETAKKPAASVGFDPLWLKDCAADVQAAFGAQLARLEAAGIALREVRLPDPDRISAMHSTIFCTETTGFYRAALPPDFALPREGEGAITHGETIAMADYLAACRQRYEMRAQVDAILAEEADLILSPVTITAAHQKAEPAIAVNGRRYDIVYGLVRLTCLFNHTGHPAAALPCAAGSLQIVAPHQDERRVFSLPEDMVIVP